MQCLRAYELVSSAGRWSTCECYQGDISSLNIHCKTERQHKCPLYTALPCLLTEAFSTAINYLIQLTWLCAYTSVVPNQRIIFKSVWVFCGSMECKMLQHVKPQKSIRHSFRKTQLVFIHLFRSLTTGYKLQIWIQFITYTTTKLQKPVTVVTAIVIVLSHEPICKYEGMSSSWWSSGHQL